MKNPGIILFKSQRRNLWETDLCRNKRNSQRFQDIDLSLFCDFLVCLVQGFSVLTAVHRDPKISWLASPGIQTRRQSWNKFLLFLTDDLLGKWLLSILESLFLKTGYLCCFCFLSRLSFSNNKIFFSGVSKKIFLCSGCECLR